MIRHCKPIKKCCQDYYTKYAKENYIVNEDDKTYEEWRSDDYLETFVRKYTSKRSL